MSAPLFAEEEIPVWKSLGGHESRADFVGLENGVLILKGEDGSPIRVPLRVLTPESRQRAQELAEAAERPETASPKAVLAHDTPFYQLRIVGEERWAEIFVKDGRGTFLPGAPIRVRSYLAKHPEGGRPTGLKMVSAGKPVADGDVLEWNLQMEMDSTITCLVRMERDALSFGYSIQAGDSLAASRIGHNLRMIFPPVLEWDPSSQSYAGAAAPDGISEEGIADTLAEHTLEVRLITERGSTTYPFADPLPKSYIGKVESVEIEGMYAPGTPTVSVPDEDVTGSLYCYGQQPPYVGFSISMKKDNPSRPADTSWFRIEFD